MSSNLLNFILWGGVFLVGVGCSTGIIDSDEEDQAIDYNEPERKGEVLDEDEIVIRQASEEYVKKCYSMLGLAPGADEKAIKKAFTKLSCTHHPDKGGDKEYFQKLSNVRAALLAYCEYLSENGLEHGASNIDFRKLIENTDIQQVLSYLDEST